jgi:hypothetical protein
MSKFKFLSVALIAAATIAAPAHRMRGDAVNFIGSAGIS